jgi:hypothetical protein
MLLQAQERYGHAGTDRVALRENLSDNDVPIEKSADLVGHRSTIVAQQLYRHQLRPVIETGATTMNTIFNRQKNPGSA